MKSKQEFDNVLGKKPTPWPTQYQAQKKGYLNIYNSKTAGTPKVSAKGADNASKNAQKGTQIKDNKDKLSQKGKGKFSKSESFDAHSWPEYDKILKIVF